VVEGTPLLRVQAGNRLEGSNPFHSATHPCLCQRSRFFPVFSRFSAGLARVIRERDDHPSLYQTDFPAPSPEAPSRASVGLGFPC
jgi:hypothetical protein